LMGLFITFLLPRLKALPGAVLTILLLAGLLAAAAHFFVSRSEWLKLTYPVLLLAAGYTVITSKRFLVTEKKKELVEASAIETNKMLGLSFQGQGMLDLAFEKFRICPVDGPMKDLLYNLGLDFERKRQFNKAVAVYEHIAISDASYKDIPKKIEMLRKAADGAVFGAIGGRSAESTVIVEGSSQTPTLGRYEVTKELGKGAMGVVYLGRDPKINRTVAIKTMRLEADNADEKTMKEIKIRFFREAQAAGNLSHPNIVKIFDAGEENDIAYIAMELLKGDDFKKWTSRENLLPLNKVVDNIASVADALGYAHKQGIIHRDIKPTNIMLLEDGAVRVTDFGIARITESSKTATGTVLGTPYYMSPEQISGKKVDGRADIFSLGVTLYELLTGERPWKGGDSVGTLFFQIASDPYPDPLAIRKDIPAGLVKVMDKALKKNPDERYQTAEEMAADLRTVAGELASAAHGKPGPAPAAAAAPVKAAAPQHGPAGQKPQAAAVLPAVKNSVGQPPAVKPVGVQPAAAPGPARQETPVKTPLPQNPAAVKPVRVQPAAAPGPVRQETPVKAPSPQNHAAPNPSPTPQAAAKPEIKPVSLSPVQGLEKPPAAGLSPSAAKNDEIKIQPVIEKPSLSGVSGTSQPIPASTAPAAKPEPAATEKPPARSVIPMAKGLEGNAPAMPKTETPAPVSPAEKSAGAPEHKTQDSAPKPQPTTPGPQSSLAGQAVPSPRSSPAAEHPKPQTGSAPKKGLDLEKTLPIIYPEDEELK
ncbi:MAG: protein kinase, partial [bacterium]